MEWVLRPSRLEYIYPQINHFSCYKNIRIGGLPSRLTSALFKLKHDIYLTEEKKYYCNIRGSNRCRHCPRTDHSGHFLICTNSKTRNACDLIISLFKRWNPSISLESIVNFDIEAEEETVLGLGWILGTVAELIYSNINITDNDIFAQLNSDLQVIKKLCISHPKYNKVESYVNMCVCASKSV